MKLKHFQLLFSVMLSLFPVEKPIGLVLLVGVPLLVLLVMSLAVCGLVLWLRTRRQQRPLVDHETSMLKVPSGADPTYGVKRNCWVTFTAFCLISLFGSILFYSPVPHVYTMYLL